MHYNKPIILLLGVGVLVFSILTIVFMLNGSEIEDGKIPFKHEETTDPIPNSNSQVHHIEKRNGGITRQNSFLETSNVTQNIPNYKDIFKEPQEENLIQRMVDDEILKKVDKEAEALIAEAEKRINEKQIVLPQKMITEKEKKRYTEIEREIELLKKQLERLHQDEE